MSISGIKKFFIRFYYINFLKLFRPDFYEKLGEEINRKKKKLPPYLFTTLFVNTGISIFEFFYLLFRFRYLNMEIPLWFTKPWGDQMLAPREFIYVIPALSFLITIFSIVVITTSIKTFLRYANSITLAMVSVTNLMLLNSLIVIFRKASIPPEPLLAVEYVNLIIPFMFSFVVVYLLTPVFINFANSKRIVTHPQMHIHPGMTLTGPSARGGGVMYVAGLLLGGLLFVGFSKEISIIYLGAFLLGALGFLDDIQNTQINSKLKFLENPFLRLALVSGVVCLLISQGIKIEAIKNPFNGQIAFDGYKMVISSLEIYPFAFLASLIWIVWILNVLSWANGIDGQYSGIMGISGILIAILALRFTPLEPQHIVYARLAIISAGASIGLIPYSWHPSKIMWGYGAVAAGLVLASLSILISSKTLISVFMIMIPLVDGVVVTARRLLHGKNPLKGDKGHLHHLLINKGWKVQKVAMFYWLTTLFFGLLGILIPENFSFFSAVVLGLITLIGIIILNLKYSKKS